MTGHIQKPEKAGNAQMASKRALWTSGYEYRAKCPNFGKKPKVGETSFCARCGRRLADGTKMQ